MCQQAVPIFCMLIRQIFFNSIDLAVVNEIHKGSVMQTLTVLGHVYHVACRRVF